MNDTNEINSNSTDDSEISQFDSENELDLEIQDDEDVPLTRNKIFSLIALGFAGFLIFVLFLFPLEEVIKSTIIDFSKSKNLTIEFKDIQFPIFGQKRIDSLVFLPTNETSIKSEEILFDVKILDLLQSKIDGEITLSSFSIDSGESSILLKNLIMEGKLSGFEERLTKTTGDLTVIIRGGKIARLPDMPLVGEIKDIDIQKGSFILKFRSGKILVERGSLDTSWFKFTTSGMIRLSDIIGLSNLDLKLCAVSQEKFANERPDLAGMLAILPQENGKACIPIKGTIKTPDFNIEAITKSSTPNNLPDATNPNPILKDSESLPQPNSP